ncbi:MAG TPA: DUF4062 domain-containing protein [Xanthobacteraceae bacterium]|nr:DUF4062 domain-containing protein [Xanthobacteraceae bacterium]
MGSKEIVQRRTVMISSTARDLPEHRQEVRLACERADFAPHDMMENLPALNADAIKASLDMVERADVYIGIFAYRYGYVPDGHDISITEMEYDRADELDKPRLIFFIHEDHQVTGKDIETGPGAAKLEKLKERIGKARVAAFFKSPADLRACVIEALNKLKAELDSGEPKDAVAKSAATLHRTSAIPRPPEPYIAHPYTLLQSRELIGRQAELNALTEWVTKPAATNDARIFCFVAIGGMGKSALTWKWFNQIAPNEMKPLAGRMWWSFYESDAAFENFVIRALCYVSGEAEEPVRTRPRQEREALLLTELNDKPYLLVLDGLERILIAYNTMDASRLADDDLDQQTANRVAGAIGLPSTAAQSFVGQHRLRQTTDPRAGAFLQKLSQVARSRILITTRLYPSELQIPTGDHRTGCISYFLRGLSDDDAIGLWRALKASGSRQELVPIFRSIENHPLLVQALASEVANDRKAPGDFAEWRDAHPTFDPIKLPLVQSRSHILRFALDGLSERAREVLSMIASFRMPASYAALEALLVGDGKACKSATELDRTLTELEDRGLIGWDRVANRYDVHPIVRGVVWQLTASKDQESIYKALDAHFEPMATPEWVEVQSLADLAPAIERYSTLIGLRRYDDAYVLFNRINYATFFRLAAHRERIALLEQLFPNGLTKLPALKSESGQSAALHSLAFSYRLAGQPDRAVPLFKRASDIDQRTGDEAGRRIVLMVLGAAQRDIGALREAEWALESALLLCRNSSGTFDEGNALQVLGLTFATEGKSLDSRRALMRFRNIAIVQQNHQIEGACAAELAQTALWVGEPAVATSWANHAWKMAADRRVERDFIRAALVQGSAALDLGKLDRADERLHHALARARAVNLVELELPSLVELAQLELERRNPAEARSRLDDVWEAAERGPYPLQQADAYNVLADIALAESDKTAAIDAATKAYRAAWCDGPPCAYHWGLKKAKAHLKALGAPEPDMPLFDESKFEPLPEVEINPKDEYWVDPDKLEDLPPS